MNSSDFSPVIRFMVVSDIHLKDTHEIEHDRFKKCISTAYKIAHKAENYNKLDAVVVVGDFANKGTRTQMESAKKILDEEMNYDETKLIVSVASHEYMTDGVEGAYQRLKEIFGCEPDNHDVINGFHFVSVSPSHSCNFDDDKISWVNSQLKIAAKDNPKKPIFMFQHPHNTGTVYGSTLWGEDELISTYMNYPQIIDFSGHSHAPINDPRSVYQDHFTCFGTGTLSYFELDEFDKICGTIPDNKQQAAQFLIVEADSDNRVRVYPYDLITDNFFPYVWKVDVPSDPSTYIYTNQRYKTNVCPYFDSNAEISVSDLTDTSFKVEFDQAKIDTDYVNSYDIVIKEKSSNTVVRQLSIWSEYYFYDMPKTRSVQINDLKPNTEYSVKVTANSFWYTKSKDSLSADIKTK